MLLLVLLLLVLVLVVLVLVLVVLVLVVLVLVLVVLVVVSVGLLISAATFVCRHRPERRLEVCGRLQAERYMGGDTKEMAC